jgi:DNA-binding MarR family transcriptional regulator
MSSPSSDSASSLTPERLRAWRLFFESALALLDRLDRDAPSALGIPMQFYDVLVHLEETPDGLRMNELADKILYSKSGLTRVVDRMEKAGLIRRYVPDTDRRSIFVLPTPKGRETMEQARLRHHDWIEENFSRQLAETDIRAITRAFEKLNAQARTRRPGRVSGG